MNNTKYVMILGVKNLRVLFQSESVEGETVCTDDVHANTLNSKMIWKKQFC